MILQWFYSDFIDLKENPWQSEQHPSPLGFDDLMIFMEISCDFSRCFMGKPLGKLWATAPPLRRSASCPTLRLFRGATPWNSKGHEKIQLQLTQPPEGKNLTRNSHDLHDISWENLAGFRWVDFPWSQTTDLREVFSDIDFESTHTPWHGAHHLVTSFFRLRTRVSTYPLRCHQTWLAGKSPMNGGFHAKITNKNGPFSSKPCLITRG